ncbi:MAG TPA: nitroreductase/quinone reductase family protein [Actinomycetota bacterium]|nr:nitroreductase/quinone reductase family protein [Actinomycetota bacterium]
MARKYRVNRAERAINAMFRLLTRLGLGAKYRHILTVGGRKTGRPYSTPVDVMERDGRRFLVAPYGVVNWVRNARAAGEVILSRGGRTERVRVSELSPEASAPVLRQYISEVRVTRPYFDVTLESTDEEFAAEAPRHPVFEVQQSSS